MYLHLSPTLLQAIRNIEGLLCPKRTIKVPCGDPLNNISASPGDK